MPGDLLERGKFRVKLFCRRNSIPEPTILVTPKSKWMVNACAYYRFYLSKVVRDTPTINICLELCARVATAAQTRNWNWPGSVTDREPYGVLCHELGHHCDRLAGTLKSYYGSEYSREVMEESKEPPITSYAPDPSEWFAEIMRLFITNHDLLRRIRPKAHSILLRKWQPVSCNDWLSELGSDVPECIIKALKNKMVIK